MKQCIMLRVGLAAPQVGKALRLFVIDTTPFSDDEDLEAEEQNQLKGFKKTFINAKMILEDGEEWCFNEGCLSIRMYVRMFIETNASQSNTVRKIL